jgi:AraC-like DNA-binding protein
MDELPACRSRRLDDCLGPLAAATTPGTAASILLARLRHLSERMRVSPQTTLAHAVLERIRSGVGPCRMSQLARELGWSERTLRRAVQGVARFGPKHFQRVYRFARAVAAADASPAPSWARIAAATGYFDQSHLIQEFLAFTGLPPQDLLRERRVQAIAEPR